MEERTKNTSNGFFPPFGLVGMLASISRMKKEGISTSYNWHYRFNGLYV